MSLSALFDALAASATCFVAFCTSVAQSLYRFVTNCAAKVCVAIENFVTNILSPCSMLSMIAFVVACIAGLVYVAFNSQTMEFAEAMYSCTAKPAYEYTVRPFIVEIAPGYEKLAKTVNVPLMFTRKITFEVISGGLSDCGYIAPALVDSITHVPNVTVATITYVGMAASGLFGVYRPYGAHAAKRMCSAASGVLMDVSDIASCWCGGTAYAIDGVAVVLDDDSVVAGIGAFANGVQRLLADTVRGIFGIIAKVFNSFLWWLRVALDIFLLTMQAMTESGTATKILKDVAASDFKSAMNATLYVVRALPLSGPTLSHFGAGTAYFVRAWRTYVVKGAGTAVEVAGGPPDVKARAEALAGLGTDAAEAAISISGSILEFAWDAVRADPTAMHSDANNTFATLSETCSRIARETRKLGAAFPFANTTEHSCKMVVSALGASVDAAIEIRSLGDAAAFEAPCFWGEMRAAAAAFGDDAEALFREFPSLLNITRLNSDVNRSAWDVIAAIASGDSERMLEVVLGRTGNGGRMFREGVARSAFGKSAGAAVLAVEYAAEVAKGAATAAANESASKKDGSSIKNIATAAIRGAVEPDPDCVFDAALEASDAVSEMLGDVAEQLSYAGIFAAHAALAPAYEAVRRKIPGINESVTLVWGPHSVPPILRLDVSANSTRAFEAIMSVLGVNKRLTEIGIDIGLATNIACKGGAVFASINIGAAAELVAAVAVGDGATLVGATGRLVVELARYATFTARTANTPSWSRKCRDSSRADGEPCGLVDPAATQRLIEALQNVSLATGAIGKAAEKLVNSFASELPPLCRNAKRSDSLANVSRLITGVANASSALVSSITVAFAHPRDFSEELFARPIAEIKNLCFAFAESMPFVENVEIPVWSTSSEIKPAVGIGGVGFGIAEMVLVANDIIVSAIQTIISDTTFLGSDNAYTSFDDALGRTRDAISIVLDGLETVYSPLQLIDPGLVQALDHAVRVPATVALTVATAALEASVSNFAACNDSAYYDLTSGLCPNRSRASRALLRLGGIGCAIDEAAKVAGRLASSAVGISGRSATFVRQLVELTQNDFNWTSAQVQDDKTFAAKFTDVGQALYEAFGRTGGVGGALIEALLASASAATDAARNDGMSATFSAHRAGAARDCTSCAVGRLPGALRKLSTKLSLGYKTSDKFPHTQEVANLIGAVAGLPSEAYNVISGIIAAVDASASGVDTNIVFTVGCSERNADSTLGKRPSMRALFDSVSTISMTGGTVISKAFSLAGNSKSTLVGERIGKLSGTSGHAVVTWIRLVAHSLMIFLRYAPDVDVAFTHYTCDSPNDFTKLLTDEAFGSIELVLKSACGVLSTFSPTLGAVGNTGVMLFHMTFVDKNSVLAQLTLSAAKVLTSFFGFLSSLETAGLSQSTTNLISACLNFVRVIFESVVQILTAMADSVLFRGMQFGRKTKYGFVGCMSHFGGCIKSVVGIGSRKRSAEDVRWADLVNGSTDDAKIDEYGGSVVAHDAMNTAEHITDVLATIAVNSSNKGCVDALKYFARSLRDISATSKPKEAFANARRFGGLPKNERSSGITYEETVDYAFGDIVSDAAVLSINDGDNSSADNKTGASSGPSILVSQRTRVNLLVCAHEILGRNNNNNNNDDDNQRTRKGSDNGADTASGNNKDRPVDLHDAIFDAGTIAAKDIASLASGIAKGWSGESDTGHASKARRDDQPSFGNGDYYYSSLGKKAKDQLSDALFGKQTTANGPVGGGGSSSSSGGGFDTAGWLNTDSDGWDELWEAFGDTWEKIKVATKDVSEDVRKRQKVEFVKSMMARAADSARTADALNGVRDSGTSSSGDSATGARDLRGRRSVRDIDSATTTTTTTTPTSTDTSALGLCIGPHEYSPYTSIIFGGMCGADDAMPCVDVPSNYDEIQGLEIVGENEFELPMPETNPSCPEWRNGNCNNATVQFAPFCEAAESRCNSSVKGSLRAQWERECASVTRGPASSQLMYAACPTESDVVISSIYRYIIWRISTTSSTRALASLRTALVMYACGKSSAASTLACRYVMANSSRPSGDVSTLDEEVGAMAAVALPGLTSTNCDLISRNRNGAFCGMFCGAPKNITGLWTTMMKTFAKRARGTASRRRMSVDAPLPGEGEGLEGVDAVIRSLEAIMRGTAGASADGSDGVSSGRRMAARGMVEDYANLSYISTNGTYADIVRGFELWTPIFEDWIDVSCTQWCSPKDLSILASSLPCTDVRMDGAKVLKEAIAAVGCVDGDDECATTGRSAICGALTHVAYDACYTNVELETDLLYYTLYKPRARVCGGFCQYQVSPAEDYWAAGDVSLDVVYASAPETCVPTSRICTQRNPNSTADSTPHTSCSCTEGWVTRSMLNMHGYPNDSDPYTCVYPYVADPSSSSTRHNALPFICPHIPIDSGGSMYAFWDDFVDVLVSVDLEAGTASGRASAYTGSSGVPEAKARFCADLCPGDEWCLSLLPIDCGYMAKNSDAMAVSGDATGNAKRILCKLFGLSAGNLTADTFPVASMLNGAKAMGAATVVTGGRMAQAYDCPAPNGAWGNNAGLWGYYVPERRVSSTSGNMVAVKTNGYTPGSRTVCAMAAPKRVGWYDGKVSEEFCPEILARLSYEEDGMSGDILTDKAECEIVDTSAENNPNDDNYMWLRKRSVDADSMDGGSGGSACKKTTPSHGMKKRHLRATANPFDASETMTCSPDGSCSITRSGERRATGEFIGSGEHESAHSTDTTNYVAQKRRRSLSGGNAQTTTTSGNEDAAAAGEIDTNDGGKTTQRRRGRSEHRPPTKDELLSRGVDPRTFSIGWRSLAGITSDQRKIDAVNENRASAILLSNSTSATSSTNNKTGRGVRSVGGSERTIGCTRYCTAGVLEGYVNFEPDHGVADRLALALARKSTCAASPLANGLEYSQLLEKCTAKSAASGATDWLTKAIAREVAITEWVEIIIALDGKACGDNCTGVLADIDAEMTASWFDKITLQETVASTSDTLKRSAKRLGSALFGERDSRTDGNAATSSETSAAALTLVKFFDSVFDGIEGTACKMRMRKNSHPYSSGACDRAERALAPNDIKDGTTSARSATSNTSASSSSSSSSSSYSPRHSWDCRIFCNHNWTDFARRTCAFEAAPIGTLFGDFVATVTKLPGKVCAAAGVPDYGPGWVSRKSSNTTTATSWFGKMSARATDAFEGLLNGSSLSLGTTGNVGGSLGALLESDPEKSSNPLVIFVRRGAQTIVVGIYDFAASFVRSEGVPVYDSPLDSARALLARCDIDPDVLTAHGAVAWLTSLDMTAPGDCDGGCGNTTSKPGLLYYAMFLFSTDCYKLRNGLMFGMFGNVSLIPRIGYVRIPSILWTGLPIFAANETVRVFDALLMPPTLIPSALVRGDSAAGCRNSSGEHVSLPYTDSCPCTPSIRSCSEDPVGILLPHDILMYAIARAGFGAVFSGRVSTYVCGVFELLGINSSFITRFSNISSWPDGTRDAADFCALTLGIAWTPITLAASPYVSYTALAIIEICLAIWMALWSLSILWTRFAIALFSELGSIYNIAIVFDRDQQADESLDGGAQDDYINGVHYLEFDYRDIPEDFSPF